MVQTRSGDIPLQKSFQNSGGPSNPIRKDLKRGIGYSESETLILCELLRVHLPIGPMAWEKVTDLHNIRNPQASRTTESLKRKFKQLYQAKPKTGNPHIPETVKQAKEIKESMARRGQISNLSAPPSRILDEIETETASNIDAGSLVQVPLSKKRSISGDKKDSNVSDILELYKLQMIEKEKDRDIEAKARREERKEMQERARLERDERREDARLQREVEAQRHDALMKILAAVVSKTKE